jgi:hypothetical protein
VKPALSVVATSRNDDHGGHLNERMQWFVDGIAWHAERHEVDVELLMVEWNPPVGRPPLAEVLRWPPSGGRVVTRLLTVPAAVHQRLIGESAMPMLQMLAKNVGIRRSSADAVLATNIDVLLTDELFSVATRGIGSGALWRADRYDVEFPFPPLGDVAEALRFCREHPIRYARRDGVYYPESGRALPIYQSLGDMGSYELRRGLRAVRARLGGINVPSGPARPVSGAGRPRSVADLLNWAGDRFDALYSVATLPKLHVNACGDFTLLAKSDWESLRGYPEWVVHSWHLDTVFLHQAHGSGLRFVELEPPCVVFHMEHGQGSGWTPEGHAEHMAKVSSKGLRTLTAADLRREKRQFARHRSTGTPIVLNGPDWGLIDDEVVESLPS